MIRDSFPVMPILSRHILFHAALPGLGHSEDGFPAPPRPSLVPAQAHLQRLTADSACSWLIPAVVSGSSMALMPPTTDAATSPWTKALAARWAATRELEQAVSVDTQGPVRPKAYDSLPTCQAQFRVIKCSGCTSLAPGNIELMVCDGSLHRATAATWARYIADCVIRSSWRAN